MISRRQFVSSLSALGLVGLAGHEGYAGTVLKPGRPRPGDTVGLVRPATAAFVSEPVEIMVEALESLGFEVVLGENYFARHGYFGGADTDRAADINHFFRDPDIRMIVASGGWGGARLLPLIDYGAVRDNPKVFLGYSDVTALHTAIHARTGLVTFHGPAPLNNFSADYFRRVVMNGEAVSMRNLSGITDNTLVQTENRIQTIAGGTARGRILGGNLTVLTTILGSPYLPDWQDSILFIEDVNEAIYRVDRMLTQLSLAGVLGKISGFVFGRCTECGPGEGYGALSMEQVLREHIEPLGIPAFSGSMIGHIEEQFTIPLGIPVEIDATAGTILMLEPAVT
jgi:muramoyltetrapeptide carboxypeptidase